MMIRCVVSPAPQGALRRARPLPPRTPFPLRPRLRAHLRASRFVPGRKLIYAGGKGAFSAPAARPAQSAPSRPPPVSLVRPALEVSRATGCRGFRAGLAASPDSGVAPCGANAPRRLFRARSARAASPPLPPVSGVRRRPAFRARCLASLRSRRAPWPPAGLRAARAVRCSWVSFLRPPCRPPWVGLAVARAIALFRPANQLAPCAAGRAALALPLGLRGAAGLRGFAPLRRRWRAVWLRCAPAARLFAPSAPCEQSTAAAQN